MSRKKLIISFPGGGVRGVVSLRLLARIEEGIGEFLEPSLYAGTSSGGLIAMGLAMGWRTGAIEQAFIRQAPAIFKDSTWDNIKDLGRLRGAEYSTKGLTQAAKHVFGDTRLEEIGRHVLVPTVVLKHATKKRWAVKVFHNLPGEDSDARTNTRLLLHDIAIRTASAPTYFPSYQGYIDGGIALNNPCMSAITALMDTRTAFPTNAADIWCLSLGTGYVPRYVSGQKRDWGYQQWASRITPMTLDVQADVHSFMADTVLGYRYHEVNPILPKAWGLDAVDAIPDLLKVADKVDLTDTIDWVKRALI